MSDILIRDIDPAIVAALKAAARRKGRSLQAELRIDLTWLARRNPSAAAKKLQKIRERLAGRTHTDSAELLREDRDR